MDKILLGAHFSISGGLHKSFDHADKYNCSAMQIFTQNSSTWKIRELSREDLEKFRERKKSSSVRSITAHAGYLINLAGPDKDKREKSLMSMRGELIRAEQLEIESLVLHPGSHRKTSVKEGIIRVADSINSLFEEFPSYGVNILFETTAGQGDSVGHRLEDIEEIISRIEDKERTGICIDTCHVFAAGYGLDNEEKYHKFIDEICSRFGIDGVKCFHLNDSKKPLGSKVDRHEHIGMGCMGDKPFYHIMNDKRFIDVPKITELPGVDSGIDMNQRNFEKLISMVES